MEYSTREFETRTWGILKKYRSVKIRKNKD